MIAAADIDMTDLERLDPRARALYYEVCHYMSKMGYAVMVTSLIRDDGIHKKWAFDWIPVDVATHLYAPIEYLTQQRILNDINRAFVYGNKADGTPTETMMWHTVDPKKKTGWHFHTQVNPRLGGSYG